MKQLVLCYGKRLSKICFGTILFTVASCSHLQRMYVDFGEVKKHQPTDDVIRIYFDRNGFVYPDYNINDDNLRYQDSRLGAYYASDTSQYFQICRQYNVIPYQGDLNTVKPWQEPLQGALLTEYDQKINDLSNDKDLVFIIHGFNEHPQKPTKANSILENKTTIDSLRSIYPDKKFQFVEIYWDGLSADLAPAILKPVNSIYIWGYSQVHATYVGLELRRLFRGLNSKTIYVITHSHGAGIITNALFNVKKFRLDHYDEPGHWLEDIKQRYNNPVYDCPLQNFNVGMLAPAIPGVNVFYRYRFRTINGIDTAVNATNYRFVVGFNLFDKVTTKYGIAPKRIGSTSLACIKDELDSTEKMLNTKENIIVDENFSRTADHKKQKSHSWLKYMKNQPHFTSFLKKVFG